MRNNLISALLLSGELDQGKSTWVRKIWKQRKQQGHYDNLIQEMRLRDHEFFLNYFRMVPSMFDELLRLVGLSLVKKTTNLREPYAILLQVNRKHRCHLIIGLVVLLFVKYLMRYQRKYGKY